MKYKKGDRIIITDETILSVYNDLLEHNKGVIYEMKPKGKLVDYYYDVSVKYKHSKGWSNIIRIGVPEFELDTQYYREKRLKKLLDDKH
jgi:hypothetical protein